MSNGSMTLPRHPPPPISAASGVSTGRQPRRSRLADEIFIVFAAAALLYTLAAEFMIRQNLIFTDATSRMANAFFVLFSRDPHLPAMGFVWNPLPSFVQLPILPFTTLFPALAVYGVAGAIQSVLSMAAATAGICICLRKLGVNRLPRLVLVGLFAGQPMIMLYAGSGQSEPMMIFFLVMVASALISWIQSRQIGHLVAAGVWLGLGYLTRYETGATAVGVAVLVGLVTLFSTSGTRQYRLKLALNDVVLVIMPFVFAFTLWAAAARILVGEWFPTFGSKYGNSAQVAAATQWIQQGTGTTFGQTLAYLGKQTVALAPLAGGVLLWAIVLGIRRRSLVVVVPLVVFGSVMAFCGLVLLMGASFGWLRFQITVIPMTVLLAGAIIGMQGSAGRAQLYFGPMSGKARRAGPAVAAVAVLLAVAAAWPIQARVLTDPGLNLAREEAPMLSDVFHPTRPGNDLRLLKMFQTEHQIAAYLAQLNPGTGTVLAASAYAFPIITSSRDPHMFVISSDFDFNSSVNGPAAHHIKYVLVRSDARSDEVQLRWPTMYANGNGIGTLVRHWVAVLGEWRLYRINATPE